MKSLLQLFLEVDLISSAIKSAQWDNGILTVLFMNGRIYRYGEVPEDVYNNFINSGSKGEYFNNFIKPKYKYEELT